MPPIEASAVDDGTGSAAAAGGGGTTAATTFSTLVKPRLLHLGRGRDGDDSSSSSRQGECVVVGKEKRENQEVDVDVDVDVDVVDSLECSVHTLPRPLLREFRHVFGDNHVRSRPGRSRAHLAVSPSLAPRRNNSSGPCGGDDDDGGGRLELLAIPTNQRAREDLVAVGDEVEAEKDRLLNVFIEFGGDLCKRLRERGYWADFIDPCSGLPMITSNCNKVYSEVDGMEVLLGYRSHNAGFCKILLHPQWGSSVYPATVFCHAPFGVVRDILGGYPDAC